MTISVLQSDIDNGVPGSPCKCALALPIERALERPIIVDCGGVFESDTVTYIADLPWRAVNFYKRFDDGQPVAPFRFDLDL